MQKTSEKKRRREEERKREGKKERVGKGKSEARRASVRQLNFSSFGTQLETPTAVIAPPCRAPTAERDGPFPRPPSSSPLPYSRRVLRPLIPTFTRRTSAIANESRLAEPEPAATRFCAAPPVSPGPPFSLVSSMLPSLRSSSALPSSFSCSPNLPNRATAQLEHPDSLFSLRLSSLPPSRVPRFTRVHTGHVEGWRAREARRGNSETFVGLKITFLENGRKSIPAWGSPFSGRYFVSSLSWENRSSSEWRRWEKFRFSDTHYCEDLRKRIFIAHDLSLFTIRKLIKR